MNNNPNTNTNQTPTTPPTTPLRAPDNAIPPMAPARPQQIARPVNDRNVAGAVARALQSNSRQGEDDKENSNPRRGGGR